MRGLLASPLGLLIGVSLGAAFFGDVVVPYPSGTDEALTLTPPVRHTLEQALEFIEEDELVEVTPQSIRLRKKLLQEHERRRADRS